MKYELFNYKFIYHYYTYLLLLFKNLLSISFIAIVVIVVNTELIKWRNESIS